MGWLGERLDDRRFRLAALALALVGGLVVWIVSTNLFPYLSLNHDEGVYLQQAGMLLDGQLFLRPPVPESFRPWFFVGSEQGFYPKYAPVAAAMFALGRLAGDYTLALAAIAAANVALLTIVVAETFRHEGRGFARAAGLLAGGLLLLSPLFLINSSTFLSYAPTTLWNLLFAAAYLRADRTGSRLLAAVAGLAIGVAFFSRPYTAVLFALPFVVHALWTLRDGRAALIRNSLTAAGGLFGVVVALGYNAVLTGDPFTFPYAAFAPLDGVGFGKRKILGHATQYTPTLALKANARVLATFFGRWGIAGVLGTVLAACGTALAIVVPRNRLHARTATLAGLFVSIPIGNVLFWGNLNILGDLETPGNGLIAFLGPYYHFDLLVPMAAFIAYAGLRGALRLHRLLQPRFDAREARIALAVCLLVAGAALAGVTASAASEPLERNGNVTAEYEQAYQPFENRSFENALVFLPTPYGRWLNHPFQALRNGPDFGGDAVYALAERQFAVVDSYPNRTYYRYVYDGSWSPTTGDASEGALRPITVRSGERLAVESRFGIPDSPESVTVRLASGDNQAYYTTTPGNGTLDLRLIAAERARVRGEVTPVNGSSIPLTGDVLTLSVFVDQGPTGGFGYRVELPFDRSGTTIRALTPTKEVCPAYRCGGGRGTVNVTRDGVSIEANFTAA
jgi:4-amino-4-deoxy-L-arabinose transferase-like glycosyltransferase